jgi:glycerate dehydrogenase
MDSWDCTVHQVTSPSETIRRLAGHSVAVTNKVVIDRPVLSSPEAKDLKLIAVATTRTDIIDREEAARRGVKVCNVPGYAAQSVAQFTMALILELATRWENTVRRSKPAKAEEPGIFTLTYPTVELQRQETRHRRLREYRANGGSTMARGFGMEVLIAARGVGRTRSGSAQPAPATESP